MDIQIHLNHLDSRLFGHKFCFLEGIHHFPGNEIHFHRYNLGIRSHQTCHCSRWHHHIVSRMVCSKSCYICKKIMKNFKCFVRRNLFLMTKSKCTQWAKKLKKSRSKKLMKSNKSISRKVFFWPNSIFGNFKNGQKSIFVEGTCLKLPEIQFHEEKNLI